MLMSISLQIQSEPVCKHVVVQYKVHSSNFSITDVPEYSVLPVRVEYFYRVPVHNSCRRWFIHIFSSDLRIRYPESKICFAISWTDEGKDQHVALAPALMLSPYCLCQGLRASVSLSSAATYESIDVGCRRWGGRPDRNDCEGTFEARSVRCHQSFRRSQGQGWKIWKTMGDPKVTPCHLRRLQVFSPDAQSQLGRRWFYDL